MKKTKKLNILIILSTLMAVILLTVFGFSATNAITRSASADETFNPNNYTYEELVQVDGPISKDDFNDIYLFIDTFGMHGCEMGKMTFLVVGTDDYQFVFNDGAKIIGRGDAFSVDLYEGYSFDALSSFTFSSYNYTVIHQVTYMYISLQEFYSSFVNNVELFDNLEIQFDSLGTISCPCGNDGSMLLVDSKATINANQEPVDVTPTEDNFFANVGDWFNTTFSTESAIVGIVVLVVAFVVIRKILK